MYSRTLLLMFGVKVKNGSHGASDGEDNLHDVSEWKEAKNAA